MGRWKKINNIDELIDKDGKPKFSCYYNMDLSNLDLSALDPSFWNGARFCRVNFSNTNIKFYPRDLALDFSSYLIQDCNFENCDLSYLEDKDFSNVALLNCNFNNTGLKIDFTNSKVFFKYYHFVGSPVIPNNLSRVTLKGVKLPDTYHNLPFNYFDYAIIDMKFIELNPEINISSAKLYEVIQDTLPSRYEECSFEKCKKLFLRWLKRDKEGKLIKFYNQMKPYFEDEDEELEFFRGYIDEKRFKELDLSYMDPKMLTSFQMDNCRIDKLKINASYKELNDAYNTNQYVKFIVDTTVRELEISNTIQDWDNLGVKKVGESNITFFTNLYLELDRICNMCCEFCRNKQMECAPYDIDRIIYHIRLIYNHINYLVIGGGEPTLKINDLIKLKEEVYMFNQLTRKIKMYINTNGSLSRDDFDLLKLEYGYQFYFSRHHYLEEKNREIFNDKNSIILSDEDFKNMKIENDTITCTCFKGGIDSLTDILKYIDYAISLGFRNILFQNIHQEDGCGSLYVDEDLFSKAINYLYLNEYGIQAPIYSSSDYVLYRLNSAGINISFKKYMKHEDIMPLWNKAEKRCFDLSMDPSGDLFETWNQSGEPIKDLTRYKYKPNIDYR